MPASVTDPTEPTPTATGPRPEECLVCFVLRRVEEAGCDETLRWAAVYRDARAPQDRALERRLRAVGGCCDCEILLNAFVPAADEDWPEELPACVGAPGGSTLPCRHWAPAPRA